MELLKGQCKADFEKWYWDKYQNYGTDFNWWHQEHQRIHLSDFLGKELLNENEMKQAVDEYNDRNGDRRHKRGV